ncbi:MAG: hypothetical protein ABSG05_01350 [Candidatus Pacearchaeota archaeon]|jgi:uncharacterized protein involved in tolerance to divalent cations
MENYPEYAWIQHSIDETNKEREKVRELTEKIKNLHKYKISYIILPNYLRRNPSFAHYIKLRSIDGSRLEAVLRNIICEN